LNITKNIYNVCVCTDIETQLHIFVHCTARAALYVNADEILTKCGLAERFERLGHVDLLRLFWFDAPYALIPISVAVSNAVDEFLKSCKRF